MQAHIANILLKILQEPQGMLSSKGVGAQMALEMLHIEAEALTKTLGSEVVDELAVKFVSNCRFLPTDGLHDGNATKSDLGISMEQIDHIGDIIIGRMGGNPWDNSQTLSEMNTRLNRLHHGQMAMDATLRATLAHSAAPSMELIQAAGITRANRSVDASPLLWAVNSNNPKLARIWLDHGMNPNGRDDTKKTAMAFAMSGEMVATLLAAGAGLDDVDGEGTWAADYWKNRQVSDSARIQMMSQAMNHLLEGNGHIDKARAKSMVLNLPAVKKMQAAMDRAGLGWWEGEPDDTIGKALCSQAILVDDNATTAAKKRMQSLLAAASNSPGARDGNNPAMLWFAQARVAVEIGASPHLHIIQDAEAIPAILGMALKEANSTMPGGLSTLKVMAAAVSNTHQLLADGLPIERSWLEPLSGAAAKCITLGTTGDGAQVLARWMAEQWKNLDQDKQEDLLPLVVPLVFYSQAYNTWNTGKNNLLLDVVLDTPCHYQDNPEKREELEHHVAAFTRFVDSISDTILREKLKGVVVALNAKVMQASCALAVESNTRPGPRF